MKTSFILFLILLSSSAIFSTPFNTKDDHQSTLPIISADADSVAIDNEFVKVKYSSTSCSKANTEGFGTRVIVALEDIVVVSESGNKNLKRGGIAVFKAAESYKTPVGKYYEVAFKTNHPPYPAPEQWLEPVKNKMVYEDDKFRVFEEILPPGDKRPLHSHAQRVVVKLNPARLTDPRFNDDGNKKGSLQVPNSVKFAEPIVHEVQNISDVPLFNIVIEMKVPAMKN